MHLTELSEAVLDFEIEDTGFESPEIDFLLQGADVADDVAPEDEFSPTSGPPVSLGDLGRWAIIGSCGNALESQAYAFLLGDARAAAVFSDFPYNVPIHGNVSGLGSQTPGISYGVR